MHRFRNALGALALLASTLPACGEKAAEAPKGAEAPKTATAAGAPAPAPAGGCDVTVKTGADAAVVDVEAGKTYCVGEQKLTRDTKYDEAKKMLADCRDGEVLEGETRLECKGVRLSFGGPVLVLSRFAPPAAAPAPAGGCDVTVKAGAAAPAVDVEAGKTYCVGEQKLTRATKYDEAKKMLADCRDGEVLIGETRLECKGVQLSFGGPVGVLSRISPNAS